MRRIRKAAGEAHQLEEILPFSHCHDEIDRLAVYEYYKEPRLLLELVDRRIVTNISKYFESYTGARREPPSFIVSADELPSYVHIPSGKQTDNVHSITWGDASSSPRMSDEEQPLSTTILRTRDSRDGRRNLMKTSPRVLATSHLRLRGVSRYSTNQGR